MIDPDLELRAALEFRLTVDDSPANDDPVWYRLVELAWPSIWSAVEPHAGGRQMHRSIRRAERPQVLVEIPPHGDVTVDVELPERWLSDVSDWGEDGLAGHFIADILARDEQDRPSSVLALRLLDDAEVWGPTRWMHLAHAQVLWGEYSTGVPRAELGLWEPAPRDWNALLGL